MGFILKFIAKIILNAAALYVARIYLPGFILGEGVMALLIGALVLALLNTFVRPILRLVSAPLVWMTFGLFNIVLNLFILWVADQLLTQLTIINISTLFWASIIISIANILF